MATTKVDVNLISATGTASSSTFLRGDGAWSGGGAMTFINTSDLSSAATYDFTAVNASSYDGYGFFLQNVVPATDDVSLELLTSTDGGSSYDTGGSDYNWEVELCGVLQLRERQCLCPGTGAWTQPCCPGTAPLP